MTTKLNCSVCGYTDIESNNCPNCSTDLSLLRMLQQLPQVMSCPGEDLCLTQITRGADEDAEIRRGFYDQPLGHVLEAEEVISGYKSTIKDYLLPDLVRAVFNRFAQSRIAVWLGVILFILSVGVGLGVVGCFFYSNPPGTSALVVLSNSSQDDGWKPSTPHWLLTTQHSATPVASTGGTPRSSPGGKPSLRLLSAWRWLLSTQDFLKGVCCGSF